MLKSAIVALCYCFLLLLASNDHLLCVVCWCEFCKSHTLFISLTALSLIKFFVYFCVHFFWKLLLRLSLFFAIV